MEHGRNTVPVKLLPGEQKLKRVVNDILSAPEYETGVLCIDYRLDNIVLDALAGKYRADIDHYPDSDDEEHVLLGPRNCAQAKNLSCQGMEKFLVYLRSSDRSGLLADTLAIYLLDVDRSDENRQSFLLLAHDAIYFRDKTLGWHKFAFAEICLLQDGLARKNGDRIIEWEFDPRFTNFAREVILLATAAPRELPERHPFSETRSLLQNAGVQKMAQSSAYIAILLDVAFAEGKGDAETLLRIETLASSLRMPTKVFLGLLKRAIAGGMRPNNLLKELKTALDLIGDEGKCVFFLDIIETSANWDGKPRREDLLDILRRDRFAGRQFVSDYMDYFIQRREAMKILQQSLVALPQDLANMALRHQHYTDSLNLQILKTGVNIHVGKYGNL